MIYLDTHVAAWLYAGLAGQLSESARKAIEGNDLFVSPMVILELHYFYEIGRTSVPGQDAVQALATDIGLQTCDLPFPSIVGSALQENWTRDPFDRIIVGQARLRAAALVTKDDLIRQHYEESVW